MNVESQGASSGCAATSRRTPASRALLFAHRNPGVPNGAGWSVDRQSFDWAVPRSRMADSPVFTSARVQSFVYIPLFFWRRMADTSSIEVPYWMARRMRLLWGSPSASNGVCRTVVSPIRMPASFM